MAYNYQENYKKTGCCKENECKGQELLLVDFIPIHNKLLILSGVSTPSD